LSPSDGDGNIIVTNNIAKHLRYNHDIIWVAPGDRKIYGNIANAIICQGHLIHSYRQNDWRTVPRYGSVSLRIVNRHVNTGEILDEMSGTWAPVVVRIINRPNNVIEYEIQVQGPSTSNILGTRNPNDMGIVMLFNTIYVPYEHLPFGGVLLDAAGGAFANVMTNMSGNITRLNIASYGQLNTVIPFASMEEYRTAVALTYEAVDPNNPGNTALTYNVLENSDIYIDEPPKIISALPSTLIVGTPYGFRIEADPQGKRPDWIGEAIGDDPLWWHWGIDSGELPPGMEFIQDDDAGVIFGTPTELGTYSFVVCIGNNHWTDARTYILKVEEPPSTEKIYL
jgi:hypothetical protein